MEQNKQDLREEIWTALTAAGETLFPGAEGRIPNFKGREDARDVLVKTDAYRRAETIKINPDSPQKPVRKQALR
ncbi:MAG: 5-formyltetrahydrofolate cyclo-ligase, partial [bacterium]